MKTVLWVMVIVLMLSLDSQKVNSQNEHGPFHAFSVFPLKGTVKLSSIVSSVSSNSVTKYKFSKPYELICKANTLVVNYPPRGDAADTITNTMVLFDPYRISRWKGRKSENYTSGDIQCGSYWVYYPHFSRQGYTSFIGHTQLPFYKPAIEIRERVKNSGYPEFYKKRWCRSPILGFKADFLYFQAIVEVTNKNLIYWVELSDIGEVPCTNRWEDVKQWQKEGWYFVK